MKNGNTCIKCASSNVRKIKGKFPMSKVDNMIKVGALKKVYVTSYVCVECGYMEEWIEKPKDLEYLAKKADEPDDFSNFV